MIARALSALLLAAMMSTPAAAQDAESFAGPHVGAGLTAVDHHFVVELSDGTTTETRNVTAWGLGGVLFAGYDASIGKSLIAGVEGAFQFGRRTAAFSDDFGTRIALRPRYGFSATARIGLVAAPRVLLFAKGGYGEHRYDVTAPAGAADGLGTTRSFVLGGGTEYRLGRKTALRAEFEHLDGTRNQFALGLAIRF